MHDTVNNVSLPLSRPDLYRSAIYGLTWICSTPLTKYLSNFMFNSHNIEISHNLWKKVHGKHIDHSVVISLTIRLTTFPDAINLPMPTCVGFISAGSKWNSRHFLPLSHPLPLKIISFILMIRNIQLVHFHCIKHITYHRILVRVPVSYEKLQYM